MICAFLLHLYPVKLWDAATSSAHAGEGQSALVTLRQHSDYVKALAYASATRTLLSAALDGKVLSWDLETASHESVALNVVEHTNSIYCVAVNDRGSVAGLGSVDREVKIWDPRTRNSFGKLLGHRDMVKAIAISPDGTHCITGGSDGELRLWDIGSRRCISRSRPHGTDDASSIWCLAVDDAWKCVYTGARNGTVQKTTLHCTDVISEPEASETLAEYSSSVLALAVNNHADALWVSTVRDGIQESSLTPKSLAGERSSSSIRVIGHETPLKQHYLQSNGIRAISADGHGNVKSWDMVGGRLVDRHDGDFDKAVERDRKESLQYIPKWCSLDTTLGHLSVHLEERDVFKAWVDSSRFYRGTHARGPGADTQPVNIGGLVLRSLFRNYTPAQSDTSTLDTAGKTSGLSGDMPGSGEGVVKDTSAAATIAKAEARSAAGEEDSADAAVEEYIQQPEARGSSASKQLPSSEHLDLDIGDIGPPGDTTVVVSQQSDPPCTLCRFSIGDAGEKADEITRCLPDWVRRCLLQPQNGGIVGDAPQLSASFRLQKGGGKSAAQTMKAVIGAKLTNMIDLQRVKVPATITVGALKEFAVTKRTLLKLHLPSQIIETPSRMQLFCSGTLLVDNAELSWVHRKIWKGKLNETVIFEIGCNDL